MKLRQFQCLSAVVDAGFNISAAATVLHATQPAISKQLRQFEEELGMDLLVRQRGRPIGLTEAGERTIVWARRALQSTENICAIARESTGAVGGTVTLATSHTHANYILLPAVVSFRRQFPRIDINVLQGTPAQVAELVRDGQVAVGITHLPAQLPNEIVGIPFITSIRLLVMPLGHPLLTEETLTLERLAQFPIIMQRSSRPQGARILRKFEEAGLRANVAVQALDADVIKTYVAAGLGVGIIPAFSYLGPTEPGLAVRNAAHLFEPAVSAVLLRRHSHLQKYIYRFLAELHPTLEPRRLAAIVLEDG